MAINPDCVGWKTETLTHHYDWHDAVLYALGVGATRNAELDYLYEGRGPKVLPTYAMVPVFKAFVPLLKAVGGDMVGVVHGNQTLHMHRALAPQGTLEVVGTVTGLYDLKRMAVGTFVIDVLDEDKEPIAQTEAQIIFRNDGDFGGPRPPKVDRVQTPDVAPDFEVISKLSDEQALLYRLSGDVNPLHADPDIASKAGFDQPILHGLCTFGYLGRAVIAQCCAGEPTGLRTLSAQFRRPVWPGDTLVVQGWRDEQRVVLSAHTQERPDDPCIANAYALLSEFA